ncbi:MAG TPA: putative zinc-binding metallopeptidase [Gemmatimonadaceae bacterium]|nr:putative zinc-binding metallopeptidase [Gemmatimonadaceae bacterium]
MAIRGSRVERLVQRLYDELGRRGLRFRPPVYLSDQWGCPDDTPLIGVPFYLADPRLERIEAEMSFEVEDDEAAMRYLRHEAGHAFNYAFQLHERPDWRATFGPYARPYRERYRADPFSRNHVRHILTWYAQKHPDEDFAETFAVWLTPDLNWRAEYEGWPALRKLEYVETVMTEIAGASPETPMPVEEDLPVEAMTYSIAQHYDEQVDVVPIEDERQFDVDLRQIFVRESDAPEGIAAHEFLRRHFREITTRVAFWTSEHPSVVRSLLDVLQRRSEALRLRVGPLEAATLVELTAFATAVVMLYRYTHVIGRARSVAARHVIGASH